jgi:PadR family transcriptional regulator, regulatory protein AphA
MSLDAAILGFLGERPRSGYDLKTRCFDGAARDFWTADQAQIYRTLERLETAKLVSVARKRQSGKPDRKVYSLTNLGQQTLSAWIGSHVPLSPPRDAFLLQLYFASGCTDDELAEHLRSRRALRQARLDDLRASALAVTRNPAESPRQASLRDAAFSGAMAVERAAIDWLDDCTDEVQGGMLPPASQIDAPAPLFGPSTA